jgi:hypothetical protein
VIPWLGKKFGSFPSPILIRGPDVRDTNINENRIQQTKKEFENIENKKDSSKADLFILEEQIGKLKDQCMVSVLLEEYIELYFSVFSYWCLEITFLLHHNIMCLFCF